MRRLVVALVAVVALLVGAAVGAVAGGANHYHGPKDKPRWLTTVCVEEDGNNCYWNAGTSGDGTGHSFWSIPVRGNRHGWTRCAVVYWRLEYSRTHNYVVDC